MNEPPIAIEIDCETGVETVRPLTEQEITQRNADVSRAEAERAEKDAKEAVELAERTALATWIASHPDLPDEARAALARATGVTLPGGSLPGTLSPGGVT
jgi:predicted RNA polymerase sigma factor